MREQGDVAAIEIRHKNGYARGEASPKLVAPGLYAFEVDIALVPGINELVLTAADSHGNISQKEITYSNGEAPRILLIPEQTEVPVGGHTFWEIFLEEKGQRRPLAPDEIKIQAERGYFEGAKYYAPQYRGEDAITVHYPGKNLEGTATIQIEKPKFTGTCQGPAQLYRGEDGKYVIQVRNASQLVANQTQLVVKLPDGLDFKNAGGDGQYRKLVNEISWKLGTVGTGGAGEFKFSIEGSKLGQRNLQVTLHSCMEKVWETSCPVIVAGECDIEHLCLTPDIRIGERATFQIKLTAKQKMKNVICEYEFPEQLIFDSHSNARMQAAGSPVSFESEGNKIIFRPVNKLAPGETVSLEVKLQAKRAGVFQNTLHVTFTTAADQPCSMKDAFTLRVH